jgi:hypothetical protein
MTYRAFDHATEFAVLTISGPIAANGDNSIIPAPGANRRIVLVDVMLQNRSAVATLIKLTNGVGGAQIEGVFCQNQGDGLAWSYPPDARPKLSVNTALVANLSGANACGVTIHYYVE